MEMIKGKNILNKVAKELNIDVKEVQGAISVTNKNETEIMDVKATTDDPVKSQQIVKTLTSIFFKEVKENLKVENMMVMNDPEVDKVPVSPSKKMNTLIGALLGLLASGGYVFLTFILDKRLRTRKFPGYSSISGNTILRGVIPNEFHRYPLPSGMGN